jgi:hypothetical protein
MTRRQHLERAVETIAGSMVFQVVAVLVIHNILWERLFRHCQLRYHSYFEPVLALEAVKIDGVKILLLAPFLALFLARGHIRWEDLDPGKQTRWFIVAIAGVMMWTFASYDINLYFDQSHWVDRMLLVGFWVALFFHPMAIIPFLVTLLVIAIQGHYPLPEGPWTWPDKRLPLDILVLFASFLLLAAGLRQRTRPMLLPFLFLCLVGATYAHAAINKARLGPSLFTWLLDNDLSNLMVAAHLNGGWLRGIGHSGALAFADVLRDLALPLAIGTFIVEISGALILVSWRLTRVILVGFVLLHLGILTTSGIFFWKWIAVDLCLLVYLRWLRRDASRSQDPRVIDRPVVFAPRLIPLGLAVIAFSPHYFNNVSFAWFDTNVANYFEIHGIGESGRRYRVDPRFFTPYDVILQQSRHYYAAPGPVLVGTYGTTLDWRLAEALEGVDTHELEEVRHQFGRIQTSPRSARVFFQFVHRYLVNAERRGGRRTVLSWLSPPFHFQRTPPANQFKSQEPLVAVEIRFVEYLRGEQKIENTVNARVVRFDLRPSAMLPDQ